MTNQVHAPAPAGGSSHPSLHSKLNSHGRVRLSQWGQLAAIAILLLSIAVLLQWSGHAYTSNFGSEEPDEPAHYVTGLMIRDYVAGGLHGSPLQFAKDYYLHYPKVALGAWPPFFYIIESMWMLVFSASRPSVLLLSAVITVSSALTLLLVARREFGMGMALGVAAAYVVLPAVQVSTASVMIDGLVAWLELLAAVQLARYVDGEKPRCAYAFAGIAALAALTKANALALVLLPLIVIATTQKWRLLRRKEIWLGILVIGAAAAPWNLFLLHLATHSVSLVRRDPLFALTRAYFYLRLLAQATGVFLPLAAVGVWAVTARAFHRKQIEGVWAATIGLLASGFLFHAAVPANVIEPRYLLSAIAPVLLLAARGVKWLVDVVPMNFLGEKGRTAVFATSAAVLFVAFMFQIPRRDQPGFSATASRLAHETTPRAILVSGSSAAEGMAVSEIAMEDSRPRHYVLRSTKVLSGSDWNGDGYRSRFTKADQVSDYLESVPVDYVLLGDRHSDDRMPHHRLLQDALRSHPERWRLAGAAGGPFSLWQRVHPLDHSNPNFSVDMNYTFHNSISTADKSSR